MKREFKVSRHTSGGPRCFKKWGEWSVGDTLAVRYIESVENKFDNTKGKENPNYLFELLEVVEMKDKGYKFPNNNLVLNTCGKLKYFMTNESVQPGEVLLVRYEGKEEVETKDYGTKEVHNVDLKLIEWEENFKMSPQDTL